MWPLKTPIGRASFVADHVAGMHSVLLGIAVPAGSSADPPGKAGMAHLCEHLHAVSCNGRLGPERLKRLTLEAFTEREETFFLLRALRGDAGILVEWLEHFLTSADVAEDVFDRERTVVLEEVVALECSEIERIDNSFMAAGYDGGLYGRPVAGVSDDIAAIGRDDSLDFMALNHVRAGLVVGLVGDIDGTGLAEEVMAAMGRADLLPADTAPPRVCAPLRPGHRRVESGLDMTYFVLGFPAMERGNADRGLLYATSAYLGDDIDSLLFRRLRSEQALIYSIRSEYHLFRDAGHLAIKGVAAAENFPAVLQSLEEVFDHMRSWSPGGETVAQLRHSLRKSLLINLDDPRNKLLRLLKHELWFAEHYTVDDDLSFIDGIDADGLSRLTAGLFNQPPLLCHGA